MREKYLTVIMPDDSEWEVPVSVIAKNRATYYFNRSDEFETFQEAYKDTADLFDADNYEIKDWAANNMNWEDVAEEATQIGNGSVDYQEGWINGLKDIVEK